MTRRVLSTSALSVLVTMLVGAGCASHTDLAADSAAIDRPNVVLILADDLGYGELGCFGQTKIHTPNLDRLAASGVRFTNFYSGAPVCAPARCTLLTGLHSGHAPIRDNREVGGFGPNEREGQMPLPRGAVTIADVLRDRGYATAAIGKWGLGGPGSEGAPDLHGFDLFYGFLCQRVAHNHYPTHLWRNGVRENLPGNTWGNVTGATYAPDLFVTEAERFIDANRTRPFFLYYPSTIPHAALQVPDDAVREYRSELDDRPYDGKTGYLPHPTPHAAYAAMITRLDRDVGRLLSALERNGLSRRTIVIFTSDNGPTHDVGGVDTGYFASSGGLRGRKGSVYEGGLRVPMIVSWPESARTAQTIDEPAVLYDVFATIADATRAAAPTTDGRSLMPLIRGERSTLDRESIYWEFPAAGYSGQQAVRMGRWKALRRDMAKGNTTLELYDLSADPRETTDVARENPDVVERAEQVLRAEHTPAASFPLPVIDQPVTR